MRCLLSIAFALASAARAATPIPCESRLTGNGSAELVCAISPGDASAVLEFSAGFSGVHDDSQAGLAATLDAAPLACIEGSTTRITGDEGGNTLVCRFVLSPGARATRQLHVQLLWFHADPAAVGLARE
jgi:hypothetical protein